MMRKRKLHYVAMARKVTLQRCQPNFIDRREKFLRD